MPSTSLIAEAQQVAGLLLQVGNGSSPESFQTIANVQDIDLPIVAEVQDVTNVADLWRRRRPTLLDMGKIGFKVWWVMTEPTHDNSSTGLRYMLINKIKKDWQVTYPDGNSSTDSFPAYVTSFHITGKVGSHFEAAIELSNSGAPSLV